MIEALSLVLLLADAPEGEVSLPRRRDTPVQQPGQQGLPADPLFDKPLTASDDPAFVLLVVESARQGVLDARAAAAGLSTPEQRAAAAAIATHQQKTLSRIEDVAKKRGWRLPQNNPVRAGAVAVAGPSRTSANFIVNQIALHESTLEKLRVQAGGEGDAELRRVLREAIPGYQKNLETLLGLKL